MHVLTAGHLLLPRQAATLVKAPTPEVTAVACAPQNAARVVAVTILARSTGARMAPRVAKEAQRCDRDKSYRPPSRRYDPGWQGNDCTPRKHCCRGKGGLNGPGHRDFGDLEVVACMGVQSIVGHQATPTISRNVPIIRIAHDGQIVAKRDAGTAVLLVSAELDEVMELSDRIGVMFRGRLVAILDAEHAEKEQVGLIMATGQAEASA